MGLRTVNNLDRRFLGKDDRPGINRTPFPSHPLILKPTVPQPIIFDLHISENTLKCTL